MTSLVRAPIRRGTAQRLGLRYPPFLHYRPRWMLGVPREVLDHPDLAYAIPRLIWVGDDDRRPQ